ncbi:MAG TPA: OmpW family outer membrane protein [Thermoanaerobaculia bacterium]|nr:OmpW family outer membrane protein [Thermoanaerobaculia bacterium]
MRKLVLVLLVALPLVAQQPPKRNNLYVFVSNPSGGWSEGGGSSYEGAIGLALQHRFTPRWSGELAVSRQRDHSGFTRFDPNGQIIEQQTYDIDSTPIDLGAQYHFLNTSSWKPYLGLGARYTSEPRFFEDRGDHILYGATGGVVWQLRPAFGIRFDGKVLLGDAGQFNRFNGSVGVTWGF